MKNSTDTNIAAKELSDALVAFSGNMTRNFMEVQTKTWEDMIKFGETATKIAADAVKEFPFSAKTFMNPWAK